MVTHISPEVSRDIFSLESRANYGQPELSIPSSRQDEASTRPPVGFPSSIQGPMVWSGKDDVSFKPYILELGPKDVAEVEQALKHFLGLGLDGSEVSDENFPLPALGPRLRECTVNIHHGSGLCIIRGLTPQVYSAEDGTVIFLGLASYIGSQRGVQTSKGAMLTHVYESPSWKVPREKRHGIHTNNSLPFHNDMGCEILALNIRNCAARGGGIYVASAAAIYNALMKANPWAVHELVKHNWPVRVSRRGTSPFVLAPLLGFQSGNLVVSADPARIGPHPALANRRVPDLLPAQKVALALLQQMATVHQVQLPIRQGDMLFINNWGMLHGRDSYQDDDLVTRHLVRLWLRNPELGWNIPESMKAPWEASFGAQAKRQVDKQYPVTPMPEYMEPKFTNGSAAFIAEESDEDKER
ncbi:Clavaminate synthase-like protein [Xylaria digitata]|nr:Clavaminate synthase-like protein [Xylaria digitata]